MRQREDVMRYLQSAPKPSFPAGRKRCIINPDILSCAMWIQLKSKEMTGIFPIPSFQGEQIQVCRAFGSAQYDMVLRLLDEDFERARRVIDAAIKRGATVIGSGSIGLLLVLQSRPPITALYVISVRRSRILPIGNFSSLNPASFRFHLTVNPLAFG